MIDFTASAVVRAVVRTAKAQGYHYAFHDEFTGIEYANAAQLASALMDAMTERLGIQCNPGGIRRLGIAVINSNGDTLHRENIDTNTIPGYRDGVMYSYGRLYHAVEDVAITVFLVNGDEFAIRLAIETLPGTDDIELAALIARVGNGPVYRIEEVHMMQG